MALELTGSTVGALIPGPVTVTKNRTALFGMARVLMKAFPATDNKICDYTINVGTNARFTIQYDSATPTQVQVGGRALDADPQRILLCPTGLSLGVWTHVIAGIDYATSTGAIYYDGVLVASGALNGALGATQTANTNSNGGGIGIRPNGSQGMVGLIEDFRLYSRIIGPAEALTIATSKGKDGIVDGLLHRYPLNDGAPGAAMVACVGLAADERIVAAPLGAPLFAAGISTPRMRQQPPIGRR
jgi:hypothetical protein